MIYLYLKYFLLVSSFPAIVNFFIIYNKLKGLYIVRVGDWDQDVEDVGEKEFVIQTVNFHPDFNIGAYLSNDIALLTIKVNILIDR